MDGSVSEKDKGNICLLALIMLVQENKPTKAQVSPTRLEDDRAKRQYLENEADKAT
jgi:hypothetical protein